MEKTCKAIFLIIGRLARFQLCDPHRTHQMCTHKANRPQASARDAIRCGLDCMCSVTICNNL